MYAKLCPLFFRSFFFFFFLMIRRPPRSTLFPSRRSSDLPGIGPRCRAKPVDRECSARHARRGCLPVRTGRSEEHTSELQSLAYLVCRLLLEKKKTWFDSLQCRTINYAAMLL